jgi:hypothetical protein
MSWGESLRGVTRAIVRAGHQEEQALAQGVRRAVGQARDTAQHVYDIGARGVSRVASGVADVGQRTWAVTKGSAAAAAGTAGAAGVLAVGGTAVATAGAYNKVRQWFSDTQPALQPLTVCSQVQGESTEARKERILRRQALIAHGKQDPRTRASAEQLERDMKTVELARLSAHVYTHYDPTSPNPSPLPQPWKVASDGELEKMGLDPLTVRDAKAAVYSVPAGFPFEPKTVVAFRGTAGEAEDIAVNHDNALGRSTRQYRASLELGKALSEVDPLPMVTGHSLGGGKAQAAVVGAGGLVRGEMFNAAGVHPDVLGVTDAELRRFSDRVQQHRTTGSVNVGGGDPLTGLQMSLSAQTLAYGAAGALSQVSKASRRGLEALEVRFGDVKSSHEEDSALAALGKRISTITDEDAARNHQRFGWYVPPTLGQGNTQSVISKNADGTDSGLVAQHSIVNMVNGYESRKLNDVQKLVKASGTSVPVQKFIGPA